MWELEGRFKSPVFIEAATMKQYSATNGTTNITEAQVNIPAKPDSGLTYRIRMTGTKTGANATMTVSLLLGATEVITLTADAVTASDWVAEFMLRIKDATNQKVSGFYLQDTEDPDVNYADGTVNLGAGAALIPRITSSHGSDVVYCEACTVEAWIK